MADSGAWYLKMNDGTVYGPADLSRLQTWAREGRVAPSSQISSDRKSWTTASRMPELGMEWVVEVEQGQYYGPFHPDVVRDLIAQKRIPASARRFRLDTGRAQEDRSKELNAALEQAKASLAEREASLAQAKTLAAERDAALAKAKTLAAERDAALAERNAVLKAEHVRVENLLEQLESAAEREKALRADLDLAHKTAASERKCAEAAIRQARQTEKELADAHKDAEDLRAKIQKAKEQSKATKGRGLFEGVSSAELAFLEQAARRELASARGRSAPVPRPQPKALDVIDV